MPAPRTLSDRPAPSDSVEALAGYLNTEMLPMLRNVRRLSDLGRVTLFFTDAAHQAAFVAAAQDLGRIAFRKSDSTFWFVSPPDGVLISM